jgi:type 1 glutamine amidotransferase
MHAEPSNEMLVTTTFLGEHAAWTESVVMPMVWKRRHGAGLMSYSALGHVAVEFSIAQMPTILRRGMLRAARQGDRLRRRKSHAAKPAAPRRRSGKGRSVPDSRQPCAGALH